MDGAVISSWLAKHWWQLIRNLGKFVSMDWLKRFYSEERIKGEIDIRTKATDACMTCSYYSQEAMCWLEVTNRSPFEIKLEKLQVKFLGNGLNIGIEKFSPEIIPPASNMEIFLQGSISILEKNYKLIQESISKNSYPRIQIEAYIICGKKEFLWKKTHNNIRNVEVNG
jgi:hypothetical protein